MQQTESSPEVQSASVQCGWGRVLFAQTYDDGAHLADDLRKEHAGQRDLAAYVEDPHVVLSHAPQELFLDPSDMLRLDLTTTQAPAPSPLFEIRRPASQAEARAISDLYLKREMVPADADYIWQERGSDTTIWLVAVDSTSGQLLGTVMGLDHVEIFGDEQGGSSLWCLAVDPAAHVSGVGEALVRALAGLFKGRDRQFMDLSVVHDNSQAKKLYDKLGFYQVRVFTLKTKNAHNQALFLGPELDEQLNPYARIIVDEARSRGIGVEVLDGDEGYFRLYRGGKGIVCRESLSELTSAVAMSRCQDKFVTHRWLRKAGFQTPAFLLADSQADNISFLEEHKKIVVKPAIGEQGKGITVGVEHVDQIETAVQHAQQFSERVLLESFHPGTDLRIVVINYKVVAAATRTPARVVGDGRQTARELINKQSRRRSAATGGESQIPLDAETQACLAAAGYAYDDVITAGEVVEVRRTANLHTGGTIDDVTSLLHPKLVQAAEQIAERLDIPVVGLDFIVAAPDEPDYVVIEANERPGLANHEPRPTAQRFIDLLFPLSMEVVTAEVPRSSMQAAP